MPWEAIGLREVRFEIDKSRNVPTRQQVFEINDLIKADIRRNFETSGANVGKRWAPNAPSTIARKGSSRPLIDKGRLIGSISTRAFERGGEAFTNLAYAAANNYGVPKSRAKKRVPLTPKVRGFMWAKFYETGDMKYRAAALSKKSHLEPAPVIPAREFMLASQRVVNEAAEILLRGPQ